MKNKIFIYAVFAALLFAACKNDPESENPPAPKTVHVQDISIKNPINPVSLVKGTTYQVEAAVLPKNADNKKISYTSSNKTLVSVNANGLISALNVGTATITLKAENISKTINVTVTSAYINVASIAVASGDENVSIVKGGTHKLSASVKPENVTDKTLTYSSDREDIASVDTNGLISAKKVGTASVTIHTANNITKTISVTVTEAEVPVTDIEFDPPLPAQPIELGIGQEYTINAKVKPDNATSKSVRITNNSPDNIAVSDKTV